jgi:hypothetical protein
MNTKNLNPSIISIEEYVLKYNRDTLIKELVELYQDVLLKDNDSLSINYHDITYAQISAQHHEILHNGLGYVYIYNNKIIGFIKAMFGKYNQSHLLENSTMLVATQYQKSIIGVGVKLMKHMLLMLPQYNIKHYIIQSRDENTMFYQKLGFEHAYSIPNGMKTSKGFVQINTLIYNVSEN